MRLPVWSLRLLVSTLRVCCPLGLAGIASSLTAAPDSPWSPVTPEERSTHWKPLETGRAVEALVWRTEIDDKRYPDDRRRTDYYKYKIFTPDKADDVMRISRTELSVNGHTTRRYEIRARLTQPDGTMKEFGPDAVLTRPGARIRRDRGEWDDFGTDVERTEKYLAVSGAETGAVLEIQVVERLTRAPMMSTDVLQIEHVPIRQLDYSYRAGNAAEYNHRFFVLNTGHAKFAQNEKTQTYTIHAEDVPALVNEPFSGAKSDYALTTFSSYIPYQMAALTAGGGESTREIDPKAGPWAVFASISRWLEEDLSAPTSAVKKAAAEIARGAADDLEKARRIHDRVQALHQEFVKRAKSRESFTRRRSVGPSLDRVLNLGSELDPELRDDDFLYLALSLYRCAGLKAELLLLPDREIARLDRKLAASAFLSDWCAAIQIGDKWHFSMPTTRAPLPFDLLPWQNQGQGGLLARANRQDFIDVPLGAAEQSSISSLGVFELAEDGTLQGDFRRSFTGQHAYRMRGALLNQDFEHQQTALKEDIAAEFKGAELVVTKIAHLNDADAALEVTYHVSWPGYAVLTAERLILRPSVFRAQAAPPFTAATRHNRILLPFRWQETDRLMIQIPASFAPESMALPPSYPGDVLGYKVAMSFDAPKRTLHLRRDFQSSVMTVPVEKYGDIKKWYDAVASSDQHELVFVRSDAAAPGGAPAGAAGATPASNAPTP